MAAEVMAAEVMAAAVMAAEVMAEVIPPDTWVATLAAIPALFTPVEVRTIRDIATTVASATIVATVITATMVGMVVATV